MMTDQNLAEAIIAMQRQDLMPTTREVVDEAARLLGEGREMEARALVEKAEALAARATIPNGNAANGKPAVANGSSRVKVGPGWAPQGIVAPLAAKLAAGFTEVLTNVLEDVHRYTGDQIQAVANALDEHIQNMEAALRHAAGVGERLEQLATEHETNLRVVQHGQEELWSAVRALQHADEEQTASITRVSAATEELTQDLVSHVDAVASRFETVDQRISLLDRFMQEMPGQMSGVMSRLDRHTEALRVLEQRQTQRVSKLNQVLDSLSRLKEEEPAELALSALA
jgi:hypothetical protein